MFNFQFYSPTHLIFGPGSVEQVGEIVARFGTETVVLMGRSHAKATGLADKLTDALREAGVEPLVIDGIASNPKLADIVEMADRLQADPPNSVVALGGGSVMDAGRLLSLALTHEGDLWDYRVIGSKGVAGIQNRLIPVITVPTTGGSGTAVSPAAMASHKSRKDVYFSPLMSPAVALVDPELALTLPRSLTLQTAMDGFTQSLEAFVASNAQPFSDMFAAKGMQLAYAALPKLAEDLKDLEARSEISLAGMLSVYAILQSGLGAVHALSDPLGAHHDIDHGLALGILLPSVMRANMEVRVEKFAKIAQLLGCDTHAMSQEEAAEAAISVVEDLIADVGLEGRLSEFGVKEEELPAFAAEAMNPAMATNPKQLSEEEVAALYREVL
jgi:alcohol dehydrogenase class IV